MTIVVGIPACARTVDGLARYDTPARYAIAVAGGARALAVLIPPLGDAQLGLLDRLDGLLVPGSPSNVHPSRYDGGASATPDSHDPERDATTLPLLRAALARGLPVLAICRGLQELNVALGGTLHQRVHALAGRADHRGGPGGLEQRYRPKHQVALSGRLATLLAAKEIAVNSLHGQAIDRLAAGLAVEATAPDGTIEAVRVENAAGFAFGVQWHPEWRYADDPASAALFGAFGNACRGYAAALRKVA